MTSIITVQTLSKLRLSCFALFSWSSKSWTIFTEITKNSVSIKLHSYSISDWVPIISKILFPIFDRRRQTGITPCLDLWTYKKTYSWYKNSTLGREGNKELREKKKRADTTWILQVKFLVHQHAFLYFVDLAYAAKYCITKNV